MIRRENKIILDKCELMYVELVGVMGNDETICNAARVSTNSKGKDNEKLLSYLWRNQHHSPFEHVIFTFVVSAPIFVARQWMRHRTGSYNEESRRYVGDEVDFYLPEILRIQDTVNRQSSYGEHPLSKHYIEKINFLYNQIEDLYYRMIQDGVAKEQARIILPVATITKFYFTMDLRNLLHFLQLRDHPHAQEEIRQYAVAIKELIKDAVPITYKIVFGEKEGSV